MLTGTFSQCPINKACVAVQDKHDGVRSAYSLSQAGLNADLVTSAICVFMDTSGRHPMNTVGGTYPVSFVQESTPSDAGNLNRLWWHLVGHGWMVHQYLTFGSFD